MVESEATETIRAELFGRVQGVGFRYFVYRAAVRRSLVGWVRNTMRGSVELMARGGTPALAQFRADLERGPALSHVQQFDWQVINDNALVATDRFAIRS